MSKETMTMPEASEPTRWKVAAAFLSVYLIWGSTYLAILFALETLPPFLMAGVRFVSAGVLLFAWSLFRGAPLPSWQHWKNAAIVGCLLLSVGNGGVVYAETTIPSSLAALLVSVMPLWMAVLEWWQSGHRPHPAVTMGIVVGFLGVALLISGRSSGDVGPTIPFGAVLVLFSSFAWAAGSLYSRKAQLPASPLMATSIEMIAGGVALVLIGTVHGDWSRFSWNVVSLNSVIALVYLTLFGSLVAFTAYIWLLRVSTPTKVSTYAYINPAVAVFLGYLIADEEITARTLVAGVIIIGAVILMTQFRSVSVPSPFPTNPTNEARSEIPSVNARNASVVLNLPRSE